jgi:flavin-dependent thymidylate synthase
VALDQWEEEVTTPAWLVEHHINRPYYQFDATGEYTGYTTPLFSRTHVEDQLAFLRDVEFNRHEFNDGSHVSPYDEGKVFVGLDGLEVTLRQGVDEDKFKSLLSRTLRATSGIAPGVELDAPDDWTEMMKGGLQSALESQVIVFEIIGASRALTHQLVRTRKAAFHQQSQRATWYGDKPNQRWPESVMKSPRVTEAWRESLLFAWEAYKVACDEGISYQDARYILPEGTTNYIICEYSVREFINVFAYRGCSMFLWEMVGAMREMRRLLVEAHPFLEPYVKISCEKGTDCERCKGRGEIPGGIDFSYPDNDVRAFTMLPCPDCKGIGSNRRCTFQGWENVEQQCDFPWAQQSNRVFLPDPKFRIGK